MNQFYDRVELALKQALRLAVADGHGAENEVPARAACIRSSSAGQPAIASQRSVATWPV